MFSIKSPSEVSSSNVELQKVITSSALIDKTCKTINKITPGCLGNKTTNRNQTCFAHMELKNTKEDTALN